MSSRIATLIAIATLGASASAFAQTPGTRAEVPEGERVVVPIPITQWQPPRIAYAAPVTMAPRPEELPQTGTELELLALAGFALIAMGAAFTTLRYRRGARLQTIAPAILAAGLCLTTSALADDLPTITIGAGVMTKTRIGTSSSGIPIDEITLTHRVGYADLNLTTQAGAAELERRVEATARAACRQLDELYPLEAKDVRECTMIALAKASPQVKSAIAGAAKETKAE